MSTEEDDDRDILDQDDDLNDDDLDDVDDLDEDDDICDECGELLDDCECDLDEDMEDCPGDCRECGLTDACAGFVTGDMANGMKQYGEVFLDESMDGDLQTGLRDAGLGTDEDYGTFDSDLD
jgi:hypothetical protein